MATKGIEFISSSTEIVGAMELSLTDHFILEFITMMPIKAFGRRLE
jgi:hypothetical protein